MLYVSLLADMVPSSSFEPNTMPYAPPQSLVDYHTLLLGLIVLFTSTGEDCRLYSSSADVAVTAPSQDVVPPSFIVRLGDGYILLYLRILGLPIVAACHVDVV